MTNRTARTTAALAVVIGVIAGATGAAIGNHAFNDVPTNNFFHEEIGRVADAGIATGFQGGNFRPKDPVNRQQMAAFINRSAGRALYVAGSTVTISGSLPLSGEAFELASGTIEAGGVEGAGVGGFLLVHGTAHASVSNESTCPCRVELALRVAAPDEIGAGCQSQVRSLQLEGSAADDGTTKAAGSVQVVCPVPSGATRRVSLLAGEEDANTGSVNAIGDITALFVPFGADGALDLDG